MENVENIEKSRAYVLYSFIDEASAERVGKPAFSILHSVKVFDALIRRALKEYFGVEAPEGNLIGPANQINGVFYSHASLRRVACIGVSDSPIGVSVQVPFDIYNKDEFMESWLSAGEIEECKKRGFDEDCIFEILTKKKAFKYKYRDTEFDGSKNMDTTKEKLFSLKRLDYDPKSFYLPDKVYYIAATGKAEFIEIPVEELI